MKVLLLLIEDTSTKARAVFYSEPLSEEGHAAESGSSHRGLRGWAERKIHALKAGWEHSETAVVSLVKRLWDRLQRSTHPDEALLARLRSAEAIDVHHPESLTADDAYEAWMFYLEGSRRRHRPWFVVNLLVAPLTILLAPLPGPNLIGYWIAYRALHHWLILIGVSRVRRGHVKTYLRPTELLDRPVVAVKSPSGIEGEKLAALGCEPSKVDAFLNRKGLGEAVAVEASGAVERP